MNEPVLFDQAALKKRVSESVSASFGMLIPEQQWAAMIEREVKAFFEEPVEIDYREETGGWNSDRKNKLKMSITPFRQMVWEKVAELSAQQIFNTRNSEKFSAHIQNQYSSQGDCIGEAVVSEHLEKLLEKMAPKMAAAFFRHALVGTVAEARNLIMNDLRQLRTN